MRTKIIILIIIILAISLSFFIIAISQNGKPKSNAKEKEASGKEISQPTQQPSLKKYTDPSGFSFNYPAELALEPEKQLDQKTYAKITLAAPNTMNAIRITVTDSSFSTIPDLLQDQGIKSSTKKITLAGLPGIRYETVARITTLVLDQGVLFEIILDSKDKNKNFTAAYDSLIKSFAFEEQTVPASSGQETQNEDSSAEDVVFEGEEIIE